MFIMRDRIRDSKLKVFPTYAETTRTFFVGGIPVTLYTPDYDVLWNAITCPGIPAYGDPHPSTGLASWNLVATDYDVGPASSNAAWVKVTYRSKSVNTISYDSGLMAELTKLDVNGNPLRVLWFPGVENPGDTINYASSKPPLGACGEASTMIPYKRVIQTKHLYFSTPNSFDDASYIDPFLGFTNNAPYRGKPAEQWLCVAASATTEDGKNVMLRREVMWKPTGWRAVIAYKFYGKIPSNAFLDKTETVNPLNPSSYDGKKTNGFVWVKVLGTADFSGLGF